MYLSPGSVAETASIHLSSFELLDRLHNYTSDSANGGWSSLIGIVTAIIGNILISFALNTQRYAHIRLNRERLEEEEKHRHVGGQKARSGRYGTTAGGVAEERMKWKGSSGREDQDGIPGQDARESDPLIHSRKSSSSSQSTIRPTKQQGSSHEKSYLRSPYWWLGIALMTVGECGNFLAYGFAPASIVSPLGVVALVSNCLIAPLMLHERFRARDALGVIIAVAGCVIVVLSASDSNPKLGPDEIWNLITTWEFETYLGITIFLIVVLMVGSIQYGDRSILIDLGLVGLFGGYTALSTKGVASLLSNTIWRAITFPITYLLVAVLATTAILQIKYVNRALQRFDSTQVIPVQFVLFTLSVIIGSAVLYRDFERKTLQDAIKFVAGCALTFLGVWFITSRRDRKSEGDEEEAMEEEEDGINLIDEEGEQPEIRQHESSGMHHSSLRPPSPRRLRSSQSNAPSLVITEEDEDSAYPSDIEDPFLSPLSPLTASAAHANLSAIHSKSTSMLPPDPLSPSKPLFHATTSAPSVPTATSSALRPLRPSTPSRSTVGPPPTQSSPSLSRTTSTPGPQQTPGRQQERPLTGRRSIANISLVPGPLTGTLSSSLSAIVADSLRRGLDVPPGVHVPPGVTVRKRRNTRGGRRGEPARRSVAEGAGPAGVASHEPLTRTQSEDVQGLELVGSPAGVGMSSERPKGRGRSLSATLNDLFRSKRQRRGSVRLEDGQE